MNRLAAPGAHDLRVAARVPCTTAEGPHVRYALWVQGCSLRCSGCCNPEMFDDGGTVVPVATLVEEVARAARDEGVEGITLLGGEPVDQAEAVAALCGQLRARGLGVLLFSGYTRDELLARPGGRALWDVVDCLVDGRFDVTRREDPGGRRFIGSRNQQLHHRTQRYADPALWQGPASVEVHVDADGRVHAHGFPVPLQALLRALRRPH